MQTVSEAKKHADEMLRVKKTVQASMLQLLKEGKEEQALSLELHRTEVSRCIKETVDDELKLNWKYFAEITPPKKRKHPSQHEDQKRPKLRVKTSPNLNKVLKLWKKKCIINSIPSIGDMNTAEGVTWRRDEAEKFACEMLRTKNCSDDAILKVLRIWGFRKNDRENVRPEGKEWVYSDTLGLVLTRGEKRNFQISDATKDSVMKLFLKYASMKLGSVFPATSITLNSSYAGKMHRDSHNAGPSVGIALGHFDGGRLQCWPEENRKKHLDLEAVRQTKSAMLNLKNRAVVFDGRYAHEVEDFTGERFSMIFFSSEHYPKAKKRDADYIREAGALWPTPQNLTKLSNKISFPRLSSNVNVTKKKLKLKRKTAHISTDEAEAITWEELPKTVKCADGKTRRMPTLKEKVHFRQPNPKRGCAKTRYERYAVAHTIEGAYQRGGWRGDMIWDFKKGFLKRGGR
jgi:hypothetical protein